MPKMQFKLESGEKRTIQIGPDERQQVAEPGKFPGSTDVVIFEWPPAAAVACYCCGKPSTCIIGPDHAPHAAGYTHGVCADHQEPGSVVQHVDAWPFTGTGLKLRTRCVCGALTTNQRYCSKTCRKDSLYPEWQKRRAEIVRRRGAGDTFRMIAKDLGLSAARVAAIYQAAVEIATAE